MVPDAGRVRRSLLAAGATPGFAGMMTDTRFDREGELAAKDELLRLRRLAPAAGPEETRISWKGPTSVSEDGHKARRELEYIVHAERVPPESLLEALGYHPALQIDRYVEYYHLGATELRLEWYPRMDTLIEVEGDAAAIDAGIRATGLDQVAFTSESLTAFVARYNERNPAPAALTVAELGSDPPSWTRR